VEFFGEHGFGCMPPWTKSEVLGRSRFVDSCHG